MVNIELGIIISYGKIEALALFMIITLIQYLSVRGPAVPQVEANVINQSEH